MPAEEENYQHETLLNSFLFSAPFIALALVVPQPSPLSLSVSGSILQSNQEPLSGVTVTLTNTATQETKITTTDQQGNYSFSDIASGTYRISPKKQDASNTNISAVDAVFVLQGVVGIKTLTPEQRMIADVSGDGILSAVDAVMILQKKVELISRFVVGERCSSDWLFLPFPHNIATLTNPNITASSCQNGEATISITSSTPTTQNFTALQFGDVSGSVAVFTDSSSDGGGVATRQYQGIDDQLKIRVIVLRYFPVRDGKVDISSVRWTSLASNITNLEELQMHVDLLQERFVTALTLGSTYHGYRDPSATPGVLYEIVDTKEYLGEVPSQPIPTSVHPSGRTVDFMAMLTPLDICKYVGEQGVQQVWVWGYPFPMRSPESTMSGPNGNISNGHGYEPLPLCKKTYVFFGLNYDVGADLALESYGHQLEAMFRRIDYDLFWNKFVGGWSGRWPDNTGTATNPRRCGWSHTPPNGVGDYDWYNMAQVYSDCEDWNPDGVGQAKIVDCRTWSKTGIGRPPCNSGDELTSASGGWKIYWMQNMPGKGNTLTYQSKKMRNWWEFVADWDGALQRGRSFTF